MKENTKKIIAGLGLGLTIGAGAIAMTGCSNIELSQSQVDKILEVVENSDKFMKDSLEMQAEMNNKLTREMAYSLYRTAIGTIQTNAHNVWDNLKINVEMSDENLNGKNYSISLYKSTENEQCLQLKDNEKQNANDVFYLQYGDRTSYEYKGGDVEILENVKIDYLIMSNVLSPVFITASDVKVSDIIGYEVLEDGNIQITTLMRVEEIGSESGHFVDVYSQYILSSDGKLLSRSMYALECASSVAIHVSAKFTFEYGKVDTSAMNAIISDIKNSEE